MTLALGALCTAAIAALLNVSVGSHFNYEAWISAAQSTSNLQASGQTLADCLKAMVPFVLLLAISQRLWAQAIATAMIMGALVFQAMPPVPAYADQLVPYRIGVFTSSPQTVADLRAGGGSTSRHIGRYQ
ncbi:MAG: hypothetical protein AAGB04_17085 [Pseudomonadota bacterium]